jgi:uncharacterized NAD(P)/FAD-binding protein YdhS
MQDSSIAINPLSRVQLHEQSVDSHNQCDIAIIGAGISCSYTVINYISLMLQRASSQRVKLVIIDKAGEFWTGIPYGNRSGQQSLIISSLQEFFPQPELDNFKEWLNRNYREVFNTPDRQAGLLVSQWQELYAADMSAGRWDELFIPRYTVGLYLKERIDQLLQAAQKLVECHLVAAEVIDVQAVGDQYQIEMATEGQSQSFLTAKKVILAMGSPPNKVNQLAPDALLGDKFCYVENMYEPTQSFNIERIGQILKKSANSQQNQVVIVGSNASALETIYSLSNHPETFRSIGKFIVISPNASFPHRICRATTTDRYQPKSLQALLQSSEPTAQKILIAVQEDVIQALAQNETVGSTYAIISKGIIAVLQKLSPDEQKLFVVKYGVEIGKFQRRASNDYLNVIEHLMTIGKLEFIKGKLTQTYSLNDQEQSFKFIDASQQEQKFSTAVQVLINCAGSQDLLSSSSSLINNLIKRGIAIPNDSNCGFLVNENFEVNHNFYLVGPLIAGNINSKFKVWHAESCARIINLSQQLAVVLANDHDLGSDTTLTCDSNSGYEMIGLNSNSLYPERRAGIEKIVNT